MRLPETRPQRRRGGCRRRARCRQPGRITRTAAAVAVSRASDRTTQSTKTWSKSVPLVRCISSSQPCCSGVGLSGRGTASRAAAWRVSRSRVTCWVAMSRPIWRTRGSAPASLSVSAQRRARARLGSPVVIDDDPAGNGDKPWPSRTSLGSAELHGVAPCPEQRLLDHVLGALPVPAGQPEHEGQQRPGVLGVQPPQRLLVQRLVAQRLVVSGSGRGRPVHGAVPRLLVLTAVGASGTGATGPTPGIAPGRSCAAHTGIVVETPRTRNGRERGHTWTT